MTTLIVLFIATTILTTVVSMLLGKKLYDSIKIKRPALAREITPTYYVFKFDKKKERFEKMIWSNELSDDPELDRLRSQIIFADRVQMVAVVAVFLALIFRIW